MNKNDENNLKLIGRNEEDLKVISAYLQDSVVVTKDILFLKKNRIFIENIRTKIFNYRRKILFKNFKSF